MSCNKGLLLVAVLAALACVASAGATDDPFDMHRFLSPQDWLSDSNTAIPPAAQAPAPVPTPAATTAAAPPAPPAIDAFRFKSTAATTTEKAATQSSEHAESHASANLEVPVAASAPVASPTDLANQLLSSLSKPWDEGETQNAEEMAKAKSVEAKDRYFQQEQTEKLRFREKMAAPAAVPAGSEMRFREQTTVDSDLAAQQHLVTALADHLQHQLTADEHEQQQAVEQLQQQTAAQAKEAESLTQPPTSPSVYLHSYYQTPVPTSTLTGPSMQQQVAQQQATQQYRQIQAQLASAREALNTYFRSRQNFGPSRKQPSTASAPGAQSSTPSGVASIDAQMQRQKEYYQQYLQAYNKYYNPGGNWGSGLPTPSVTAASTGQPTQVQPQAQAPAAVQTQVAAQPAQAQPAQAQPQGPQFAATVVGAPASNGPVKARIIHSSADGKGPLGRLPSMASRVPGNDNLGLPYQLPIAASGSLGSRQPGDTFELKGKRLFHPVVLPDSKPKGYVPPAIVSGVPAIVIGENTQYPVSTSCSSPDCVKPVVVPKVPSYAASIVASPLDGDCGCDTCPCGGQPVSVSSCGCDTCPCQSEPAPSSCGCDTCPCSGAKTVPKLLVTPDVEECGCNSCPCARPPVNSCGCDTCPCSTACGCDSCPCQNTVKFSSSNGVTVDEDAYNQITSAGNNEDDLSPLGDGTGSADLDPSGNDRLQSSPSSSSPDSADSKRAKLDALNDELPKTEAGRRHRKAIEDEVKERRAQLGVPSAGQVLSEANGKHGTILELDPSHPRSRNIRKAVENPEDSDSVGSDDLLTPMEQQMRELEMDRRRLMAQVSKTRQAISGLGMKHSYEDMMNEKISLDDEAPSRSPPPPPPRRVAPAAPPKRDTQQAKNDTKVNKDGSKVGEAAKMMFSDDLANINKTIEKAKSPNKTDSEIASDLKKLEKSGSSSEGTRLEEELLAIRLKKDADKKIVDSSKNGKPASPLAKAESALAGDIVNKLDAMKTASPEEKKALGDAIALETKKLAEVEKKEEDDERAEKERVIEKKLEDDLKAKNRDRDDSSDSTQAGPLDHDKEHQMIRDFIEDQVEFNKKVSHQLETVEQELHGGPVPAHAAHGLPFLTKDDLPDNLGLTDDDGSDPEKELGPRVGPLQRAARRTILDPTDPNTVVHESTRLIYAKGSRTAHPNDVAYELPTPLGDFVAPLHVMPPHLPSLPSVPDLHILPIRGGHQHAGVDANVAAANVEVYRHPSIPMIKVHHVRSYPLLRFSSAQPTPIVHDYSKSTPTPSSAQLAKEIRLLIDESKALETL